MAVFQAVDAFRLITGAEPDAERMQRHFASHGRLKPISKNGEDNACNGSSTAISSC